MEKESVLNKAVNGFKFTLIAQILVLLLSLVKSIILPKVLSISDYGYWQVYVFYSAYVGLFALGYNDGIYLKYGKYQYNQLPLKTLRTSTRFYVIMLLVFALVVSVFSLFIVDGNRCFAMIGVSVDIFLMGINGLLVYILQITNQMKSYSFYSVLDKIILLILIVIISIIPNGSFAWVIVADVFSKSVVTVALVYRFRDLFYGKGVTKEEGWIEFVSDIKVGINLMIANLMGMFVTGIGRFIVDTFGDITEYAYYSFGITVTNLVLVFITAVSLVLYPTLKRLPETSYSKYFEKLNFSVTLFNFLALFTYFPVVIFIKYFLPNYAPILAYLHFLFAVIVLQAKMQLLNNTFYKVLREEKALMKANMGCVILFLIIALLAYFLTRQVTAIAVSTFVTMLYRCYFSEVFLRRKMGLSISKDMFIEIVCVLAYVLVITFMSFMQSLIVYFVLFVCVLIIFGPKIKVYLFRFKKG